MQKTFVYLAGLFYILFLAGCQSPKFSYPAPAPSLNRSGPIILIMPLTDSRTNREMDKVLEKGYLNDVQQAIGDELSSINFFSSVIITTNENTFPISDFRLNPTLYRLDWEIPHYGTLEAKAFTVGLLTGLVGGSIYAATGINVYGHSILDVQISQGTNLQPILNFQYSNTVTNRLRKAVCDTPKTKAGVMVQAFQKSMSDLKIDLQKNLSTNSVVK
jgi:hypothetical protein